MSASTGFAILSLSVNNVLWTPYLPQNNCNEVSIVNTSSDVIYMRTTDSDPTTQIALASGQELHIGARPLAKPSGAEPFRFVAGLAAAFFQSASSQNTGPIQVIEQF